MLRLFFLTLILPFSVLGQTKDTKSSLSPDALSAKALLENIVVRRYTQDLSTRLTPDLFSVGAEMGIQLIEFGEVRAQEPISDLMLGVLDPEQLTEEIAGQQGAADLLGTFLSQYRIESVTLSVGLQPSVSKTKREEITSWLEERVPKEFGAKSKAMVNYIEKTTPAQDPTKTPLDYLHDYQDLVGQLVLALALIIGALFLGFLARPKKAQTEPTEKKATNGENNIKHAQALAEEKAKQRSLAIEKKQRDEDKIRQDIVELVSQIQEVLPKASDHFEGLVRKWCQLGESGRFRLVCFSEAVSKDLGKLPIPVDAMKEIKRMFEQMPQVKPKEKRDTLEKVYWDLLTVINLGIEGLTEPFSYLGQANVETVQSVLMEKNSKMRTLVALYMPERLRQEFVSSLDDEKKTELLMNAADLQEVSAKDFKSLDDQLGFQIQKMESGGEDTVRLEMTLHKIVSGFSLREQIHNLKKVPAEKLKVYKQTTPNLAFLDEWPEKELRKLLSEANSDEIAMYLRVLPEAGGKLLNLCPPLTAQLVKDELKRDSDLSDNEMNRLLENLLDKMVNLHELREINLQKMFANIDSPSASAA